MYLQSVRLATPANVVIGTLGMSLSFILIVGLSYFLRFTITFLKVKRKYFPACCSTKQTESLRFTNISYITYVTLSAIINIFTADVGDVIFVKLFLNFTRNVDCCENGAAVNLMLCCALCIKTKVSASRRHSHHKPENVFSTIGNDF